MFVVLVGWGRGVGTTLGHGSLLPGRGFVSVRVECVLCFLCLTSSCLQILAVLKTLGVTNILAFSGVTICLLQSRCTLAAGNSKLL